MKLTSEQMILAARLVAVLKEEREPHLAQPFVALYAQLLNQLADQVEGDIIALKLAIATLDLLA